MIKNFKGLMESTLAKGPKTIAIACAADSSCLAVAKEAEAIGLSKCILIGDKDDIVRISREIDYNVREENIVHADTEPEAASIAVSLVKSGEAHLPMKGLIQTNNFLRAILNKEAGLCKAGTLVGQIGVFEKPEGGLLMITDSAMNIAPTLSEKVSLVKNAVKLAQGLGYKVPKVAILSFLEQVNPNYSSSTDAALLSKMADRGQIKNCIIDGPLAFDNIISKEAAEHKGISSPVAGQADIILVPNIDTGNPLFKALTMYAKMKAAGLIAGAEVPIIMSPRADPVETKLYSIALGQYVL